MDDYPAIAINSEPACLESGRVPHDFDSVLDEPLSEAETQIQHLLTLPDCGCCDAPEVLGNLLREQIQLTDCGDIRPATFYVFISDRLRDIPTQLRDHVRGTWFFASLGDVGWVGNGWRCEFLIIGE